MYFKYVCIKRLDSILIQVFNIMGAVASWFYKQSITVNQVCSYASEFLACIEWVTLCTSVRYVAKWITQFVFTMLLHTAALYGMQAKNYQKDTMYFAVIITAEKPVQYILQVINVNEWKYGSASYILNNFKCNHKKLHNDLFV